MKFKSVANPKSERLIVRTTREEKDDIKSRADACGLSVAEFVLKACQGRQTRTRFDLKLIEELRTIGMRLKEIYQAELPREATELDPVMAEIIQAVIRISEESRLRI